MKENIFPIELINQLKKKTKDNIHVRKTLKNLNINIFGNSSIEIIIVEIENNNMKTYGLTVRGIIKKNDEILVVKRHPKSKTDPGMWELPGGKVEKGEYFVDALVREIKEETDLDVDVGDFCEALQNDYPHKRTVQIMMYLENVRGDVKISDEHTEWMWASLEKIKTLDKSTSFEKLLKKRNWEI